MEYFYSFMEQMKRKKIWNIIVEDMLKWDI